MIGEVFDGKYRVVRLLGQGGMGSVYEAEKIDNGEGVALKCIEGRVLAHSKTSVGRFQREARAMAALDTDHVVRVLDAGTDPVSQAPYMVMELLRGEDLQHLLDRLGTLEPSTALRIAAQVCIALEKAHEARIVHRDIKPANIFVARRDGGDVVVKILDFGIAKIKPEPNQGGPTTGLTRTGGILGSPLYMSPEQARGLSNIDYRTDLWSLGMVLYRALSGKLPYEHIGAFGDLIIAICSRAPLPIQELAPWVQPEAAAVVHLALALDAEDRIPSAAAMLDAIRKLLPDGLALREALLVAADDTTRAFVAPKLVMARSPDDAHRRIARITARVGEVFDGAATTAKIPDGPRGPSAGGAMTTAEMSAATVSRDREAPSVKDTGAARAHSRWTTPAVAGLLLASGFVALRLSGASSRAEGYSSNEAATNAVAAITPPAPREGTTAAAAVVPALQHAKLVVLPDGVSVEIDGKLAAVEGREVAIEGAPGSRHRLRLFKGEQELTREVTLTDGGASPETLELEAAKPARPPTPQGAASARAPAARPAPSSSATPASDDPIIPDKFK